MTYSLGVPNDVGLLGLQRFTQAAVFETGVNAFGGVVSDAAVAVIGN